MLVSMETCYNYEPMLFSRYVYIKNKLIGEKKKISKKIAVTTVLRRAHDMQKASFLTTRLIYFRVWQKEGKVYPSLGCHQELLKVYTHCILGNFSLFFLPSADFFQN